jgi:predicted Ser/Thr protein kinase
MTDRAELLTELLLSHERGRPTSEELAPWIARLPESEHAAFLAEVAFVYGLQRSPSTPISSAPRQHDPERIERYVVLGVIARRPGSTVYHALDESLGRELAIKLLPPSHDERARERFRREARILAELDDPGVVRIHDIGELDGSPWIALEYIAGPDLSRVGVRAAPPGEQALAEDPRAEVGRCAELARILERLHERGLIHRDLKPSNVLIRPDGRVVLADFGLARILEQDSSLTGTLVGTPVYMAPELAREPSQAQPAVDSYALACLTVERLSGQAPFPGRSATEIVAALHRGEAPFASETWPQIPAELVPTLRAALDPLPRHRLELALLREDLEAFAAGTPLRHGARSRAARLRRVLHRSQRSILLLLGILLLSTAAVLTLNRDPAAPLQDPALVESRLAEAVQLVFDTGDLESVTDPVTRHQEGYSPIARHFLRDARTDWEKERLRRARRLLALIPPSPDRALLRRVLRCREGQPQVGDPDALRKLEGASGSFFRALHILAQREIDGEGRPYSALRPLDLPPVLRAEFLSELRNAQGEDSLWRGWAKILEAQFHRLSGDAARFAAAAQEIPMLLSGSFWGDWFALVASTGNAPEPGRLLMHAALSRRHPQSSMAREIVVALAILESASTLRLAWQRHQQKPEQAMFIGHLGHGASSFDLASSADRAQIWQVLEHWSPHGSSPLLRMHVDAFLLGLREDAPQIESPVRIPAAAFTQLRRVIRELAVLPAAEITRLCGDSDTGGIETAARRAIERRVERSVANFVLQEFNDKGRVWLTHIAARLGLLPRLLAAELPGIAAGSGVLRTFHERYSIAHSRRLGPALQQSPDPHDRLLGIALEAARALDRILTSDAELYESIAEALELPPLSEAGKELAQSLMRPGLTELENLDVSNDADRYRSTGIAYMYARNAGLIRDPELFERAFAVLAQHAPHLRPHELAQLRIRLAGSTFRQSR